MSEARAWSLRELSHWKNSPLTDEQLDEVRRWLLDETGIQRPTKARLLAWSEEQIEYRAPVFGGDRDETIASLNLGLVNKLQFLLWGGERWLPKSRAAGE